MSRAKETFSTLRNAQWSSNTKLNSDILPRFGELARFEFTESRAAYVFACDLFHRKFSITNVLGQTQLHVGKNRDKLQLHFVI